VVVVGNGHGLATQCANLLFFWALPLKSRLMTPVPPGVALT